MDDFFNVILEKLNTDGIESLTIDDRVALITGDIDASEVEKTAINEIIQSVFNGR